MRKRFIVIASISALLAVALGAMGAHALEGHLSPDSLNSYSTAVEYQLYHSLALLAVAILYAQKPCTPYKVSGYLFIAGIVLFSGSIYLLSTTAISGMQFSFLGPVTPLGGLCFMAGWVALGLGAFSGKQPSK